MDLAEIGLECKVWVCLAQGRLKWQALANRTRNFRFHNIQGTSSL
jgi:hypothetical protein